MTEQEVITLPVGPQLDAAVAEHVMNFRWALNWCGDYRFLDDPQNPFLEPFRPADLALPTCKYRGPHFSTDDTLAMSVLCKARGEPPAHFVLAPRREGSGYLCHLEIDNGYVGFGELLREAICRCCLLLAVTRKIEVVVKPS